MKSQLFFSLIIILLLGSCKTEFEKIRTSNDPEKIYKKANKYYKQKEWFRAQNLYELVIPFYRGKAEAEKLFYQYAYTHYNMSDYLLASHYFKSFSKTYYNSSLKEEADYMSAYSFYNLSPNSRLDQSYSQKAVEAFQIFINTYPLSERVNLCNDLIDEMRAKMEQKAFDQGLLYYNTKFYVSAIKSFDNMLKDYPGTKKAEEVRYLILKSGYDYADNSIYEKKSERFQQVIKKYEFFNRKYPKSDYSKELKTIYKKSLEKYNQYNS